MGNVYYSVIRVYISIYFSEYVFLISENGIIYLPIQELCNGESLMGHNSDIGHNMIPAMY